jgi:hypothetical protein
MLYCFGDSWGKGHELDLSYEVPFINVLAQKSNVEFTNISEGGCSLGKITHSIFQNTFKKEDFVVIIVPPDTRWYYENESGGMTSLFVTSSGHLRSMNDLEMREYNHWLHTMIHKKTWFQYHISLFIFSIQQYLETTSTNYMFIHNYGQVTPFGVFDTIINKHRFLDFNRSLTSLLTGVEEEDLFKLTQNNPYHNIFSGEYFEGKESHPNQKGHIRISDMIYNTEVYQKWLNKKYLYK